MRCLSGFLRRHCAVLCSFGVIQAMQLATPLLALPWLARMLDPETFGFLMYMCLIPPLVALFMDWGLALGGGRAAAIARGSDRKLRELLGAAFGAKLILAAVCIAGCLCIWPALPYASAHPFAYSLAILAGMARGLSPAWFFQGAGFGMPLVAVLDAAASLTTLGLVFLLIREPAQWAWYLLFLAATKGVAYGCLTARLCLRYRPVPDFRLGLELIKSCATLFGASFSLLFCYNGGQIALGWFLNAPEMGVTGAVNKMLRALASLVNPFSQTLFPELCILQGRNPHDAGRIFRWSLALTAILACVCTAIIWLIAPWLVKIALGSRYGNAAQVLRISLLAAPLMACNNVLANQGLVPAGLERSQLAIQAGCALCSFPCAAFLGALWGIDGGASLPVCMEGGMLAAFCGVLLFRKKP